jgi:hypothetical protein
MSSKLMENRLVYLAASAFVAWHTVAISVAPMPESSDLVQALRRFLDPYLGVLRLDNGWGYFAPTIGKWPQLKYVIEDPAGKLHTFVPVDAVNRYHPLYRRLGYWYGEIMESPDLYADYAAELLCRRHPDLKPVRITLLEVVETDYWPEDRLRGKQPRDMEYVTMNTLKTAECNN